MELRVVSLIEVNKSIDHDVEINAVDEEHKAMDIAADNNNHESQQVESIEMNANAPKGPLDQHESDEVTTYARVAFLGYSENLDEWVNICDVTCVHPIDTMSGGVRGDSIIRDEIVYVVTTAAASGAHKVRSW